MITILGFQLALLVLFLNFLAFLAVPGKGQELSFDLHLGIKKFLQSSVPHRIPHKEVHQREITLSWGAGIIQSA